MGHKPNAVTRDRRRRNHECNPSSFRKRTDTSNPNAHRCPGCGAFWDRVASDNLKEGIHLEWQQMTFPNDADSEK